jgi:hypothetical protein
MDNDQVGRKVSLLRVSALRDKLAVQGLFGLSERLHGFLVFDRRRAPRPGQDRIMPMYEDIGPVQVACLGVRKLSPAVHRRCGRAFL